MTYRIPLSHPSYLPYIEEVLVEQERVMRSGMIAMGEKVQQFEQMVAGYTRCRHAVAVSSGTAALFLALKAIGIGRGDEVITTPFSFIASSNAILHTGAIPRFIDIDRETYNIDMETAIDNRRRAKAIIPVDIFGSPVDTMDWYAEYEDEAYIVLDSCESFGAKMSRPFDAQVFAFYPNKQITTGEGGMICTDNGDIADYCRAARNQGRAATDKWLESSIVGYNFRMTDMQAALGIVQMRHIDEILDDRHEVYKRYLHNLVLDNRIKLQKFGTDWMRLSPFVFTVEVDNRDMVMQKMLDSGIEVKPYFPCIHLQPPYRVMGYNEGMFPVAELVASRTLALPFYSAMTFEQVDEVCGKLVSCL
jgi:perosamine synthetase